MRKLVLQVAFAVALSLGAIVAYSVNVSAGGGLNVEGAFAPASLGAGKSGAVYFTIKNTGTDDRLVSATSSAARKVQLHTTKHEDGVMKMRMLDGLDVPAGGEAVLKPGGHHFMLFGLERPLKEGDSLSVTLTFQHAGEVKIEVPVKPAMHGMSH